MERIDTSKPTHEESELGEQKNPVPSEEVTDTASEEAVSPPRRKMPLKLLLGVFLGTAAITAGGIFAYRSWQYAKNYQETDNAYVAADIQPVTSRIWGVVTEIPIKDNQSVAPGTVLVKLDPRDSQLLLAQTKAALEVAKQQAAAAQENMNATASADVPRQITIPQTKLDSLGKSKATADRVIVPQINNSQKDIYRQQYKAALAAIAQAQTEVQQAQLQLSYTSISALVPGQVGNKKVQVGQRVQPGPSLMEIVQQRPWIIANFKETQLEKIQPGQKVQIKINALPSRKFSGKVESVSPASFARFSPPSPDNTMGNLTNINTVPKIPVKIVFDPQSIKGYESRISPGISAIVTVETR